MTLQKLIIFLLILFIATFFRFYRLGVNPPGLYWDEAVFGYDAYSILKTGKDHHGVFMPLFFESFGDWKLPVYHYALVPSIAIFGLNEFAVRFPSATAGILTVVAFFFLVKRLTQNWTLSLSSAFFLAISPWHVQFSRGGFESTVGLFFVTLSVYLLILAFENKKTGVLILGLISATVSIYSYHAYRIFTPLLLLVLFFFYLDKIRKNLKGLILAIFISAALASPLLIFTFSFEGRARAISQSAFDAQKYESERIKFDQSSKKPLRFLSNYWRKSLYYSYQALENYVAHFSPVFLFFKGDQIGRHSQVDMGQIYLFEGLLLVFAPLTFRKLNQNAQKVMLAMLILAPIPATIVTPNPHAYRTLQMVLPLSFFSACGATFFYSRKRSIFLKGLISLVIIYSFLTYYHLLFIHYPNKFAADWQDGYRQMAEKVQKYQDQFDKVYITNINQVPYIYLLFYQQYDPQKFISQKGARDHFDKYSFIPVDFNIYEKGRLLYVAPSWQKIDGDFLAAVDDSSGRHIYSLWRINGQN